MLLLINIHRRRFSTSDANAPVPFRLLRFRDGDSAYTYLKVFAADVWFIRAVQAAMLIATGTVPVGIPHPGRLTNAAAAAAASGLLQIGVEPDDGIEISFDPVRGYERPGFDSLVFPSLQVAGVLLFTALISRSNADAFSAALRHPLRPINNDIGGAAVDAELADQVAPLLWRRSLMLQLVGLSQHRYRLFWADRSAPVALVATDTAPTSELPRRRQSVAAPASRRLVSQLPDAPKAVGPQAQTLIAAARDGTPFCEECVRRAPETVAAQKESMTICGVSG